MPLGRADIMKAGLLLLEEAGLEAFSMRALATRLGVGASALYWHVGDKAEIISLMAQSFYLEAFSRATTAGDWREWLVTYGHAFRTALLDHRDSARLCASATPAASEAQDAAEALAAPLVDRGLDRATALSCQASVISLTLGWAIYEQSNALHDHLAAMIGFDASFAYGLEAMVAGFGREAANI